HDDERAPTECRLAILIVAIGQDVNRNGCASLGGATFEAEENKRHGRPLVDADVAVLRLAICPHERRRACFQALPGFALQFRRCESPTHREMFRPKRTCPLWADWRNLLRLSLVGPS